MKEGLNGPSFLLLFIAEFGIVIYSKYEQTESAQN